jgi:hypothetical protein
VTASQIIAKFETYVDDTTELSTAEELALLNKVYQKIADERPWEILKVEGSGTMASTTTITMPANFAHFVENMNMTDNSEQAWANSKPTGILINGNKWLQIINWSDRRQYLNQDGFAYLDIAASLIVTPFAQPASATYSFDYKSVPADLLIGGTPIFPARFHDMIYHAMAVDDMIIQLFDRARSYAQENQAMYNSYLQRMCLWNANLINN